MFIQLKYNIIGTGRTKALPKGETKLNYFQKDIETMPRKKIEELHSPEIKGIRGMGLMLGLEVEPEKRAGFVADLLDKGVMVLTAGADAIRLLPPLVICYEEMDEALAAMKEVF